MFGSTVFTTGATSFATNGTFSPNLKAAGISAGITALFAGIEGGIRAANDERNFWTGEKIEEWQPTSVERLRMQTPKFNKNVELQITRSEIRDLNIHSIEVNRTWETNESTISTFSIDEGQLEGYFLEPPGPSSMIEGSGLRISKGIFQLDYYSSTSFPNHFILRNVPGRTLVLIHGGIGPGNTSACFIIGSEIGLNSISGWQDMMNSLRTYIINNGGPRNFYMIIN